jgi:hypothetical protein
LTANPERGSSLRRARCGNKCPQPTVIFAAWPSLDARRDVNAKGPDGRYSFRNVLGRQTTRQDDA